MRPSEGRREEEKRLGKEGGGVEETKEGEEAMLGGESCEEARN